MDSTINSPQQLKEYAESILESIKTFSNTVWKCSPEQAISTLAQRPELVCCPFNPTHRMPASALEEHMLKCTSHYQEVPPLHDQVSSRLAYGGCAAVVELDDTPPPPLDYTQQKLFYEHQNPIASSTQPGAKESPIADFQTHNETTLQECEQRKIAISERLHKYIFDVQRAKVIKQSRPEYTPLEQDIIGLKIHEALHQQSTFEQQRQKTVLEILAEQRDYKRRRAKYRAQNVHLTRRSPTEIARSIIELHMMEYAKLAELSSSTHQENERRHAEQRHGKHRHSDRHHHKHDV